MEWGKTKVSGTVVSAKQVQRQYKDRRTSVQADPNKRRVFDFRCVSASLIVCRSSRRLSGPLNLIVGRLHPARNEPQANGALETLSPHDAVSRARLRMTVGEALGEQFPLIVVRRPDAHSAHDREHQTQSHNPP